MVAPTSPGTVIRRARERRRWTQRQLADELGVSIRAVNDWENDRKLPRMLGDVEHVLGISLSGGEAEPEDDPMPYVHGMDRIPDHTLETVRRIWAEKDVPPDDRLDAMAWIVALRIRADRTVG